MSSYTAKQYDDQRHLSLRIARAIHDGQCVVCGRRSQGVWPSGVRRITCGADECYRKWLRVRPESPAHAGEGEREA